MGLSDVTSHVVWAIVVVTVLGGSALAAFEHAETVDEARRAAESARRERLLARVPSATFCWVDVDETVHLTTVNQGSVPIDLAGVAILLDGVPHDVADAGAWSPSEVHTFRLDGVSVEPTRAMLVLPRGDLVYAQKVTCPVLASIVVTPASATMAIGDVVSFTAIGYDQYGAPIDGAPYSWSSAAGSVLQTSGTTAQLTAGTTSGAFTLVAASGGVTGSAAVTIVPDPPATVELSPLVAAAPTGGTRQFTAVVRDQYGNLNTTADVAWATDAGSVDDAGLLTAQTTPASGRTVTATSEGIAASATVDVVPAAPATVTVSPAAPTVYFNGTQQFTATVRDAYGNVNSTAAVTWSATTGSVTSGGLYTAPSTAGTSTVTATADGQSGAATVAVKREVHVTGVATYKSGAPASTFRKGTDAVEVRVTVRDHENVLVQGASVTLEYVNSNNVVMSTQTATTGAGGLASVSYSLPNNASQGGWTARVTVVSGSQLVYNAAANTATSAAFTVTP